jgi:hypothetical protein
MDEEQEEEMEKHTRSLLAGLATDPEALRTRP